MRRLLLLTPDFPPARGGVARYLSAFADHYADRIRVIAEPKEGSGAFDTTAGYPVVRRALSRASGPWRWLHAVSILKEERGNYDLAVVSHVLPFGTAAWIAKRFTGKPYAVVVHGMDVALARRNPWKRLVAEIVLRGAAVVVANTRALADEVCEAFGARVVVVYPSVALDGGKRQTRSDDGKFHLLTVSRLVPRKGHQRVLRALAALPEGLRRRTRYEIVGEGPERARIEQAVRSLGLSSVVSFTGDLDDARLKQAYASADAFVMPVVRDARDREGFGMAYLEAAAFGVPSIATDMPGVDEAVLDCETGLLVRDGSVHELAAAIELLMTVPDARRFLGDRAEKRAKESFTPKAVFAPLSDLL